MDVLGAMASQVCGIPWILREANESSCYPANWKNWIRVHCTSSAVAIVSNSHGGDEYWSAKLPSSFRFVIHNALPFDDIDNSFEKCPAELQNMRTPFVLFAGRIDAQKQPGYFIKAFALANRLVETKAVICGEGPQLCNGGAREKVGCRRQSQFSWPRANSFRMGTHEARVGFRFSE